MANNLYVLDANGFQIKNFYNYKGDKRTLLNNCIESELGLNILNCALESDIRPNIKQAKLF